MGYYYSTLNGKLRSAKSLIFELKVLKKSTQPGSALDQIKHKRYADKYKKPGTTVYLVGVGFDPEDRNISEFEWEMA